MSRAIEKVLAAESDSRGAERKREKASADAGAKKTRVRRTAAKADTVVKAEATEQPARTRRGQTRLTADQPAETPSGVRKKTAAGRKTAESYKLKVIPLGGLGEVGKNMMLIEYGDDILVVDGGLSFPEDGMYGIDLVIPDHTYLIENKDKVRAYLLTHGHEDHIGGMPYILQNVPAPVYGLPLTLGLLRGKLNEHHLSADMRAVAPREELVIGHFRVEFIRVTHSIPDSMGLAIHTPV
ncbi:MAG: ribonuclease J, partial [Firmicutes bacterium]|nr:ribonuclease J [Bacillota bacterium]